MSRRDGGRWQLFERLSIPRLGSRSFIGRDADGGACHYYELFVLRSNIAAFMAKSLDPK